MPNFVLKSMEVASTFLEYCFPVFHFQHVCVFISEMCFLQTKYLKAYFKNNQWPQADSNKPLNKVKMKIQDQYKIVRIIDEKFKKDIETLKKKCCKWKTQWAYELLTF
jgi:hypothetical protein